MKYFIGGTALVLSGLTAVNTSARVDSDFKEYPDERFTIATGDGNYKQAYYWQFNPQGTGPEVVVFLNHGRGGEWYKEISTEFGPCGPDHIDDTLCSIDERGQRTLADHQQHFVLVGDTLDTFMKRKIVGSTAFAAWYWQDAFSSSDSPVHIFMVGRYNVAKQADAFDNVLYWLDVTDPDSVAKNTQPPYNFDGFGVAGIDRELRPEHAAPELSAFDNVYLYKAVKERHPELDLTNIVVEGRSNGGSAAIVLAADSSVWTADMHAFWARNLPAAESDPLQVRDDIQDFAGGDVFDSITLVHSLYPGCSMGGIIQKKGYLEEDEVRADGDNKYGYKVHLPLMMAFAAQDSLYKDACDDRVTEGRDNSTIAPLLYNDWGVDGTAAVEGEVFSPARHGFDYKDVYKNLDKYSQSSRDKAAQSRAAIEKAVNTVATEMGLQIDWEIPYNID